MTTEEKYSKIIKTGNCKNIHCDEGDVNECYFASRCKEGSGGDAIKEAIENQKEQQ